MEKVTLQLVRDDAFSHHWVVKGHPDITVTRWGGAISRWAAFRDGEQIFRADDRESITRMIADEITDLSSENRDLREQNKRLISYVQDLEAQVTRLREESQK